MMTTEKEIRTLAIGVGVHVDTYAPGDGVKRYRFFDKESDYFGPENGIYTALGRREALVWLHGFAKGQRIKRFPPKIQKA